MKIGLALLFMLSLVFSPLAMAGELGSADSNFLFSSDQVAATTISAEEMQSTQGQQRFSFNGFVVIIEGIPSDVEPGPIQSPTIGDASGSLFNACSLGPNSPGDCINVVQ
jgi:hypothetical protein